VLEDQEACPLSVSTSYTFLGARYKEICMVFAQKCIINNNFSSDFSKLENAPKFVENSKRKILIH